MRCMLCGWVDRRRECFGGVLAMKTGSFYTPRGKGGDFVEKFDKSAHPTGTDLIWTLYSTEASKGLTPSLGWATASDMLHCQRICSPVPLSAKPVPEIEWWIRTRDTFHHVPDS